MQESEIEVDGNWMIYEANKVLTSVFFWTNQGNVTLAEKVLREELGLVDERNGPKEPTLDYDCVKLVYENKEGSNPGVYHVHLTFGGSKLEPNIYFHYWLDRMTPQDFAEDPMMEAMQKVYEAITPNRITGPLNIEINEHPWK